MLKGTPFSNQHGRIEKISKHTGYTRTAVKHWLVKDALPRSPEERIEVAQKLGIDLIYWEYGINYTSLKETTVNDASIYRAIFQVVDEKNYHSSITQDEMTTIKDIIQCASNQSLFKDLVLLVEKLIELSIESPSKTTIK
jgi:hypothetical protein